MVILNKEVNNSVLNKVIEMGYLNERGFIVIVQGRLVDFSEYSIVLDTSEDFQSMDLNDYKVENIKYYFRVCQDNMWR